MSTTASTITILATTAALVFGAIGIQTYWIVRTLDRIDARLDRIEGVLMSFSERITRLEEHTNG
jgi:hypothetical protein